MKYEASYITFTFIHNTLAFIVALMIIITLFMIAL